VLIRKACGEREGLDSVVTAVPLEGTADAGE
jgi:hypothetical protein